MRPSIVALLVLSAGLAAAEAPSNQAIARQLIAESLAPLLELVEAEYPQHALAVRADQSTMTATYLAGGYTELLLERGYEVYELKGRQDAPEGALLLELTPLAVGIRFGRIEKAFLGLGPGKVQRTAQLELILSLSEPQSGQLLYDQERAHQRVDWIPVAERVMPAAPNPLFTSGGAAAQSGGKVTPHVSWLERGIAVGLLSGIIIVYFSASS